MASTDLPFVEQDEAQRQAQQPPQGDFQGITNQWNSFLAQPESRAFLMNAGISLMQPPRFGDTFASQFGRALGHGAEAVGRGELQEAKVGELEARGRAALERSAYAGERLSLQQMVQDQLNKRAEAGQETQLYKAYVADLQSAKKQHQVAMDKYVKERDNLTRDPKLGPPVPPKPLPPDPTFEEWLSVRAPGIYQRMFKGKAAPKKEAPKEDEGE